jgi:phosphoglycolate phosphatase-like HAD superfamily hydrolase
MPISMTSPPSLIAFDMDGVLIDVSPSYREATRQASRLFFSGAHGWHLLPDPFFSLAELADIKQSGGLNNDWDVTYRVIQLLCQRITRKQTPIDTDSPWKSYQNTLATWDVTPLARFLTSTRHPLTRLLSENEGLNTVDAFVAGNYQGDVGSGNIIKQIFQEIYLGSDLFYNTYGFSPALYMGNGLNQQESPIIDPVSIQQLARENVLAIATGRPAAEAECGLEMFGLKKYFPIVLTLDDCQKAEQNQVKNKRKSVSLSKPNPFMLDAIANLLVELPETRYYVGDMPDDMLAASRSQAKFIGIGFTASVQDKTGLEEKLRANGASKVFDTAAALLQFLSAPD